MLATGRQKVDGATGALTTIKFHDDTLYAQERDGAVFVAIGPICDGLGIDWRAQLKRLQRDQVLMEGVSVMDTPSNGGMQSTTALRLDLVNGWLFGIGANQVKPRRGRFLREAARKCASRHR